MTGSRTARVVDRHAEGDTCRLTLEMSDGGPLEFSGGQYIIADTGLLLPDGKKRKRAYSIMSSDEQQTRFELAARRLEIGLGSQWFHALQVDEQVCFSGPWGKLRPPSADEHGPVWVIATDTGVTAALGLLSGRGFAARRAESRLVWWSESSRYFLSFHEVLPRVADCAEVHLGEIARIGSAERAASVDQRLDELLVRELPTHVTLIGDGQVVLRVQAFLVAQGVDADRIQTETFFHHLQRKASSERAA